MLSAFWTDLYTQSLVFILLEFNLISLYFEEFDGYGKSKRCDG